MSKASMLSLATILLAALVASCQQVVITEPEPPDPKDPKPSDCAVWADSSQDDLVFDGMQVLQVIEVGDEVPLITGRPFLVRVQLRYAQSSAKPLGAPIQVVVHVTNRLGLDEAVEAEGPDCVPTVVSLDDMSTTYNAIVPAKWLEADVSLVVTASTTGDQGVEIAGLRLPRDGELNLAVVEPPPFRITFVPIIYEGIAADIEGVEALEYMMSWSYPRFPFDVVDAVYRDPMTTTGEDGETWGAASARILGELAQLRIIDGSDRYYYGLLPLEAFSPGGGRGFLGQPVALGRDVNLSGNRGGLVAHELGHNFGLLHVPLCNGDLTGADPQYPYEKGMIGVYGYDWSANRLMLPTSGDIMSYCPPWWISDYHYKKVLEFRAAEASGTLLRSRPASDDTVTTSSADSLATTRPSTKDHAAKRRNLRRSANGR